MPERHDRHCFGDIISPNGRVPIRAKGVTQPSRPRHTSARPSVTGFTLFNLARSLTRRRYCTMQRTRLR